MLLLHILLFLLKLIGIVLLVILGLIVLILAVVLFTPVRYRIGASKYQTIQAEGKVTWLFRLIEMMFKLDTGAEEGKRLHLSFRVAWHRFYDNQKPKEQRIKQKKTRKTKSKQATVQKDAKAQTSKSGQAVKTEQASKVEDETPKLAQPEMSKTGHKSTQNQEFTKPQDSRIYENKSKDENETKPPIEGPKESVLEKIIRLIKGFTGKVLSLIRGIFSIIFSILRIPSKIMEGLEKLENLLTRIREKKEAFLKFYYEEQNHRWFTAFWQRLKKLLLKILPKADKLYLHFGFDDPATTGQVLGGLSILYPVCGEKMELCPEFGEEILEGEAKFHGSIRPVVLVIFAVKSFLNKQFFAIVKQFKCLLRGE